MPAVEELPEALAEMKPTVMASVPLVFERAFDRIQQMVEEGPGGKKKIFDWAVGEGQKQLEKKLAGQSGFFDGAKKLVADKLVFRKIKDRFGGRLQMVVSGGAALPSHIEKFFQGVGVGIYQGYGLTESSPLLTINYPGNYKPGSVGVLGKGVEVEIAPDGEILAKSPGLMSGYWNRESATRDAFDERGFFRTGDLGYLDADGFLFITGRKKDLLVLADGSNVAPVPIEHLLCAAPIIQQAVVVGDGRPHLGALLIPDLDRLGYSKSPRDQVVLMNEVLEPVREVVRTVNRLLQSHEQIRNFRLLLVDLHGRNRRADADPQGPPAGGARKVPRRDRRSLPRRARGLRSSSSASDENFVDGAGRRAGAATKPRWFRRLPPSASRQPRKASRRSGGSTESGEFGSRRRLSLLACFETGEPFERVHVSGHAGFLLERQDFPSEDYVLFRRQPHHPVDDPEELVDLLAAELPLKEQAGEPQLERSPPVVVATGPLV